MSGESPDVVVHLAEPAGPAELGDLVHPEDRAAARSVLAAMAAGQTRERHATWRLRTGDDAWRRAEVVVVNRLADPVVRAVVLTARFVEEAPPAAPADAAAPAPEPVPEPAAGPAPTTVLVVDDHEANRALLGRILRRAGHTVVEAEDAASALARVDEAPVPPGLLLTDVVLPGASGGELAGRLRTRVPGLPVVFVSGFGTMLDHYGIRDERVVAKPFRPDELLGAVDAALADAA